MFFPQYFYPVSILDMEETSFSQARMWWGVPVSFHHLKEEFSITDESPFLFSPGDCFCLFLNVFSTQTAASWLLAAECEHVLTASPASVPPRAPVCWAATPWVCQTFAMEALAEVKLRQDFSDTGLTVLNPLGNGILGQKWPPGSKYLLQ